VNPRLEDDHQNHSDRIALPGQHSGGTPTAPGAQETPGLPAN